MKSHLLLASTVAVIGSTVLAGCGGSDADDFDARWSVRDVQQRFRELGGVGLQARPSYGDTTSLTLQTGTTDEELVRRRFGGAEVSVVTSAEALERRRESTSGLETAVMDNVVVRAGYAQEREGFERAVRIVRSLGRPVGSVRLPAGETPCDRAGIDPDGGTSRTGTCLAGQRTVTIADAEGDLRLPGATASRASVRVTRTLTDDRYEPTRRIRAAGQFVVARVRIENTADEPLERIKADLIINGRRYAADRTNTLVLQDRPFPIQPGGVADLTFIFDVPRTAEDPATGGALQFSADPRGGGVASRAAVVGRIRLG